MTRLSHRVNTKAGDGLAMQEAKASAAMVLTQLPRRHHYTVNITKAGQYETNSQTYYCLSGKLWYLKSPASWLFTQPFIHTQIKENIKAPRHWPLCGEFTGDRWIHRTNGQ